MAAPRRVIEIAIEATDLIELEAIARSRTEWACRVQRARILLAYHANPSTYAVGEAIGVTHQTVQRCLDRAVRFGVMAALDDSPRRGKEPTITDAARAWVVSLACQKPKEVGYPHELWTTRLLARHAREAAETAGHPCLTRLPQGTSARSSTNTTCSRTRFATTSNAATRRLSKRWRKCCGSIAKWRFCARPKRFSRTSRSSPTTRSRASRQSPAPLPTCRRNRGLTRVGGAIMNTNVMARRACSPGST